MEGSSLPFDSILADCLAYVRTAHGEVHAQRLFFELYNAIPSAASSAIPRS